jgi:hypothetical protein
MYRVKVTDVLAREAISNPVTIGFARFVNIELSIETAPGSDVFEPIGDGYAPFEFNNDIDVTYAWSSAEEFYHGPDPALTIDQSHLFLSAAPGGAVAGECLRWGWSECGRTRRNAHGVRRRHAGVCFAR